MQSILQTHDHTEFGLYARTVYGLNVFSANGYKVPPSDDPQIVFLKTLSLEQPCSVHVGSVGLRDLADEPEELFGQPDHPNGYVLTRVGLMEGTFYDANDKSCFFPAASEAFWSTSKLDGIRDPIQYLIECGAVALYANARSGTQAMLRLVSSFPALQPALNPSQSEWLQAVASLYQLVVVVGQDGMDLTAYTSEASHFDLLSSPLQAAFDAVEASDWYKQHQGDLSWDDEYEKCLMLPESLEALFGG